MGKSRLSDLARIPSVRAAAASLWHELEEYSWPNVRDAAKSYPAAKLNGNRLTIDIGDRYCVVVAINFALGIALIEFAGLKSARRRGAVAAASRKST